MLWIFYSFISAFTLSTADALSKKALSRFDEYIIAWTRVAFAAPLLTVILFFIEIPELDATFWMVTAMLLPLEIGAKIMYIKAIKASPLSLTIPFLAFTPVFLILTSFIFLGEIPNLYGVIGILLVVAGGYTLNIQEFKEGIFEPVKAVFKEKGSLYMLIIAFVYSITSNLGKIAILHSTPLFFGAIYYVIVAIVFTPVALWRSQEMRNLNFFRDNYSRIIFPLIGIAITLSIFAHNLAIVLTNVSYMIAVKRTSMLFSVGYDYFIFEERKIMGRLVGCVIMIVGVGMIMVYG
ncbi:MAG: DMT family transporter [Nitrospirota bacterium]